MATLLLASTWSCVGSGGLGSPEFFPGRNLEVVCLSIKILYALCCVVRTWQGTVNGIGERTGNANLMTIIPTLQLKMGVKGVGEHLTNLTALSRFTDEQVSEWFD